MWVHVELVELGKLRESITAPCARGGCTGLRLHHPARGSHVAWVHNFGWQAPLARHVVEWKQVVQQDPLPLPGREHSDSLEPACGAGWVHD